MSQYVAIHKDGVIAVSCKEATDAVDQIEFYDIEDVQYFINLNTGKIYKGVIEDEDNELLVVEKHPKFEDDSINVVFNDSEMQRSIIFFLFMW